MDLFENVNSKDERLDKDGTVQIDNGILSKIFNFLRFISDKLQTLKLASTTLINSATKQPNRELLLSLLLSLLNGNKTEKENVLKTISIDNFRDILKLIQELMLNNYLIQFYNYSSDIEALNQDKINSLKHSKLGLTFNTEEDFQSFKLNLNSVLVKTIDLIHLLESELCNEANSKYSMIANIANGTLFPYDPLLNSCNTDFKKATRVNQIIYDSKKTPNESQPSPAPTQSPDPTHLGMHEWRISFKKI